MGSPGGDWALLVIGALILRRVAHVRACQSGHDRGTVVDERFMASRAEAPADLFNSS